MPFQRKIYSFRLPLKLGDALRDGLDIGNTALHHRQKQNAEGNAGKDRRDGVDPLIRGNPVEFVHGDIVIENIFLRDARSDAGEHKKQNQREDCRDADETQNLMGELAAFRCISQCNTPFPRRS